MVPVMAPVTLPAAPVVSTHHDIGSPNVFARAVNSPQCATVDTRRPRLTAHIRRPPHKPHLRARVCGEVDEELDVDVGLEGRREEVEVRVHLTVVAVVIRRRQRSGARGQGGDGRERRGCGADDCEGHRGRDGDGD